MQIWTILRTAATSQYGLYIYTEVAFKTYLHTFPQHSPEVITKKSSSIPSHAQKHCANNRESSGCLVHFRHND